MFDMGFSELVLIFVVLLVVVGPERLPKVARTLGLWIGKARSMVSSVKSEVARELRAEELRQALQNQKSSGDFKQLTDQVKSLDNALRDTERDINRAATPTPTTAAKPASDPKPAPVSIDKPSSPE